MALDRRHHLTRLLPVVDLAGAAPLLVREQERVGDVEVTIRGAVFPVGAVAGLILVPRHEVR